MHTPYGAQLLVPFGFKSLKECDLLSFALHFEIYPTICRTHSRRVSVMLASCYLCADMSC